tara:strand:+ start:67 stop:321 length:255 start_codon:yes stop_codon:yes gene_type:complete
MREKLLSFPKLSQVVCLPFSSIAMSTYPNTLESIIGPTLESVLNELEEIHPPLNPTPDESMEKIMYRSGQRSVVEWIKNKIEEG